MARKHLDTFPVVKGSDEDLLNIVRNGLPETSSKKKIVVVGAGMAGLSAAYVLNKAGHEVTILEASNRVGGRVMTYRDIAGWQVELGAMRIPENHKIVQYFIKELFQLDTEEFLDYDPEVYYYINGVRQKIKDYEKNPESFGFDLLPEERGKSFMELLNAAMEPYLEELRSIGYDSFLKKYDHFSFAQFLESKTNLSCGAISLIGKLRNIEGFLNLTFPINAVKYSTHGVYSKVLHLPGGNDQLPKAFQQELNERIIFNAKVTKIRQHSQKVHVEWQNERDSTKFTVKGDYLLMTTSAPAASVVEFDPPLSIEKQDALRMVYHDSATKIALVFSVRFWEDEGIRGGKTSTDLPARQFYYFSGNATFLGGVVMSYTWGHDSYRLVGISKEECLRIALDNLAEIHGQHIREFYLGGVVKHWLNDPFSLGAFTKFFPGQYDKIFDGMNKDEGRLYFTGKYMDFPFNWIEIAMKAGLRAASAIHSMEDDV